MQNTVVKIHATLRSANLEILENLESLRSSALGFPAIISDLLSKRKGLPLNGRGEGLACVQSHFLDI